MGAKIGWALAVLAVALGYVIYGWQGVVLAISVVVFWLLLQFSRAMRAMRAAADSPVGHVASAVMLNARLQRGMRLAQVITMTRSLGRRTADDPETFEWRDASGATVQAEFVDGRCTRWRLSRDPTPP